MTFLLIALLSCLLWSSLSFAKNFYVVRRGDTLSGISKKVFPRQPIYGPNGKMGLLIRLNNIKRPNYIVPNQTLIYEEDKREEAPVLLTPVETPKAADTAPAPEPVIPDLPPETPSISEEKAPDQEFSSTALVGFKHMTVDQKKALGRGETNGTYMDLRLNLEMKRALMRYGLNFETYVFNHEKDGSDESVRMNSFDLYGIYNSFVVGLMSEQLPLFRNNGGSLELTRQTIYSASVGYLKVLPLTQLDSTSLRFYPWVNLPFYGSVTKPGVNLENTSGYGAHVRLDLIREIYKGQGYVASLSWSNQADYEKYSSRAKWDVSRGQSESIITSFSSVIGVKVDY